MGEFLDYVGKKVMVFKEEIHGTNVEELSSDEKAIRREQIRVLLEVLQIFSKNLESGKDNWKLLKQYEGALEAEILFYK